jgi:hypothetical protein
MVKPFQLTLPEISGEDYGKAVTVATNAATAISAITMRSFVREK